MSSRTKNGSENKTAIKIPKKPFAGRTEDIRVLIKNKHTSPNQDSIIEVFKSGPSIDGIDDADGIAKMINFHTNEVDETLATLQKGLIGPPYHEELIQFRFKDKPIASKDLPRSALCEAEGEESVRSDGKTKSLAASQGVGQSQGWGQNQGPSFGKNLGAIGSNSSGSNSNSHGLSNMGSAFNSMFGSKNGEGKIEIGNISEETKQARIKTAAAVKAAIKTKIGK
jgi:hypothetical protein